MKKKQILAMGLSAVLACTSLPAAFAADESTQVPAAEQPAATDTAAEPAEQATKSFRLGSMATVTEAMLETSVCIHICWRRPMMTSRSAST